MAAAVGETAAEPLYAPLIPTPWLTVREAAQVLPLLALDDQGGRQSREAAFERRRRQGQARCSSGPSGWTSGWSTTADATRV